MGVTIVGDAVAGEGDSNMKEGTPFAALMGALARSMNFGVSGANGSMQSPVPKGTLRVVIAAKAEPIFKDAPPAAIAK